MDYYALKKIFIFKLRTYFFKNIILYPQILLWWFNLTEYLPYNCIPEKETYTAIFFCRNGVCQFLLGS